MRCWRSKRAGTRRSRRALSSCRSVLCAVSALRDGSSSVSCVIATSPPAERLAGALHPSRRDSPESEVSLEHDKDHGDVENGEGGCHEIGAVRQFGKTQPDREAERKEDDPNGTPQFAGPNPPARSPRMPTSRSRLQRSSIPSISRSVTATSPLAGPPPPLRIHNHKVEIGPLSRTNCDTNWKRHWARTLSGSKRLGRDLPSAQIPRLFTPRASARRSHSVGSESCDPRRVRAAPP